jgi:hypothetical protein
MVDNVTSQTLLDGERLVIQKFTNISDGTGESNVVKVNVSALAKNAFGVACTGVKINKVWVGSPGMAVLIKWEATTPTLAWAVPKDRQNEMYFGPQFGGITNDATAPGRTGNITFSTVGAATGASYTIILECIKTYG